MRPADTAPRRLAIIGCGAVAQHMYARTLPRVPQLRTVYVCDPDHAAAESLARRLGATVASFETIRNEAEAVIVAAPPGLHREIVDQCLRPERVVVCEKPFVGTVAEATQLVERAARLQCPLHVGHFRRASPAVGLARQLLATRSLGRLKRVYINEGGRFDWATRSSYVSRDPLGGVLYDTGSHSLDMAIYAAGLDEQDLGIRIVEFRRDQPEPAHEIEAAFMLVGDFPDVEIRLHLSRRESLANCLRFELDGGMLDLPVAPRNVVRLSGPHGSMLLHSDMPSLTQLDCLTAQWASIFGADTAQPFLARRFLGLTAILESLGRA